MTTIAYKDGVVAFDSYCTAGDIVVDSNRNKSAKHDGVTFVFAGDVRHEQALINAYFGSGETLESNTQAFAIDSGVLTHIGFDEDGSYSAEVVIEPCFAVGSGQRFALGAMDAGCSAVEAVKIACNRDIYSGGKVRKVKV